MGTGENTEFPSHQVLVWDDKKQEILFTFDMNEPIHSLAYTREMFTVAKEY